MMSVKEYAEDMNLDIEIVIKKAKELNIAAESEDDMLDQDAITMLDTNFGEFEEEIEETDENEEEDIDDIEEEYEDIIEIDIEPKTQKLKKKSERIKAVQEKGNKTDFKKSKKEMYKNKRKLVSNTPAEMNSETLYYKDGMTVACIAKELEVNVAEIIKKLMDLGLMLTANSDLSIEQVELIAVDFDKIVKRAETTDEMNFEMFEINDKEEDMQPRPPVVTIMGHVDHGKTTLLDTIRKTNVVEGEAGGITQAVSAYQVETNEKLITFIDTPGHAAFTEMRARGASVTDIVIIIVAANDGVMPQTKEAVEHAIAANVPIIVALNKMDLEGANPDKIKTDLSELGLTPEEWGGETLYNEISAKTGEGIEKLLENILLIAELQDLKANRNRYATGTVIESRLDKQVGTVCTLLVQNGTLRLGDPVVVGTHFGKIRTLTNDKGEEIVKAFPSAPVSVTGLCDTPNAGDKFMAFDSEKTARAIAEKRKIKAKEDELEKNMPTTLEDLFAQINEGVKEVNVILKADVQGSKEAVKNSLEKIEVEGARVKVISAGVGGITEGDISLAKASNAIIIGFNIRPDNKIKDYANISNVEIRMYNIIYKVVEEMESAMKGMLDPEYEEKILGVAEVKQLFKFSKVGTIAGCLINEGVIKSSSKARIIRDSAVIYDGEIHSIQREKDQVKEVKKGIECGITLENFSDIKPGDIIETYDIVEVKRF